MFVVDTPGVSTANLKTLPFRRIPRPIYPLDRDTPRPPDSNPPMRYAHSNRQEDLQCHSLAHVELFLRVLFRPAAALSIGFPAMLKAASTSETYWDVVRNHFPFTEARVPMNAANLCPSIRAVSERVAEFTRDIDVDCSFHNREKFAKLLEESRAKIAGQLGAYGGRDRAGPQYQRGEQHHQ